MAAQVSVAERWKSALRSVFVHKLPLASRGTQVFGLVPPLPLAKTLWSQRMVVTELEKVVQPIEERKTFP